MSVLGLPGFDTVPLKSMADIVLGKMLQPQDLRKGDIEVPYLRSASLQDGNVLDLAGAKTMWASPKEKEAMNLRAGDVVVSEGGSVGRAVVLHEDLPGFIFQNSVNRVRPVNGSDGRYLAYVLTTIRHSGYFSVYCDAVSIAHLTAEKLGRLRIPAATADIQRRIADYLDRETATIEALIEKQRNLIRLLTERRTGVLLQASGSGTSWPMRPIKRSLQKTFAPARDTKAPVVTAFRDGQVIARNERRPEGYTESAAHSGYQEVRSGDLVYHGLDGFAGAVGVSESDGICSPVYHVCRPQSPDVYLPFIAYQLRALGISNFLEAFSWSVRQRSVDYRNWPTFAALEISCPSLEEQRRIAEQIDRETAEIDALIAKAERFIELAQERRAALITAAVTGQIEIPTED